nr:hypothetical protein GCM10010200_075920 [Actinomadura rugatobispora]
MSRPGRHRSGTWHWRRRSLWGRKGRAKVGTPPVPVVRAAALPATAHLDRLALALCDAGWTCARRYVDDRPLLRVFDERLTWLGESVTVVPGPTSIPTFPVLWFRSSTGALLAPCTDVESAAEQVHMLLASWVAMVFSNADPR